MPARDGTRRRIEQGDTLPLVFDVPAVGTISGTFVVTHYDKRTATLHTCGHCFPHNARAEKLRLLQTSGYQTAEEGAEHATLKVERPHRFTDTVDGLPLRVANALVARRSSQVWLRRNRHWLE